MWTTWQAEDGEGGVVAGEWRITRDRGELHEGPTFKCESRRTADELALLLNASRRFNENV